MRTIPKGNLSAAALLAAFLCQLAPQPGHAQAGAGQSAIVLNYQRFGDDRYPDTSVAIEQFDAQIALFSGNRYNVIPATEIVETLYEDQVLPNRSVAITIDDAYRSVYEIAWPRLKAAGLPFTLFVSTDAIDDGGPAFMTWDQIRELRDAGVTIGVHGAAHAHMTTLSDDEIRADIERATRRIEEELGVRPALFSYPHGEISLAVRDAAVAAGFKAAYGQFSGVVNAALDRHMLPRFSINSKYGTNAEFAKRVNALGLPFRDVSPQDPLIRQAAPPVIGFTIDSSVGRTRDLHCFYSDTDGGFVEIPLTDLGERRYELRFPETFPAGPWRVNCALPTGGKRIRWWGMQYYSVS